MHVAMIQNINALTQKSLRTSRKESKKKSMMSRLSPDAEELFYLLSATSWREKSPRLNSFMRKLVRDKDASKAINMVQSKTVGWTGMISSKQLVQFFSSGYRARNIDHSPGGFTAFMCHPYSSSYQHSKAAARAATRSMFGDSTLNDETINYYTQQEFFLPRTYDDVKNQLETTVRLLELLTDRDSIAVEGYSSALFQWKDRPAAFYNLLSTRPSFGIEYVFMADKIFQGFLERLSRYTERKRPLSDARREVSLDTFQAHNVGMALHGLDFGSFPHLTLPSSLRLSENAPSSSGRVVSPDNAPGTSGSKSGPDWWTENPSPVEAWKVPKGKEHGDIFNSKNNPKAAEVEFPSIDHHKTGTPRVVCIRYQATGKCKASCSRAHIDPRRLSKDAYEKIDKAIKTLYAGI